MDTARKFNELNYAGPSAGPYRMKKIEIFDSVPFVVRKSFGLCLPGFIIECKTLVFLLKSDTE
jgi:hypothetical protein